MKPANARRVKAMMKMHKVMHEYKEGELRGGVGRGQRVKSRKQAVAIAMAESKKEKC